MKRTGLIPCVIRCKVLDMGENRKFNAIFQHIGDICPYILLIRCEVASNYLICTFNKGFLLFIPKFVN